MRRLVTTAILVSLFGLPGTASLAQTRLLRIVSYNIEADINGVIAPRPGLIAPSNDPTNVASGGVLEGLGEEMIEADPAHPVDILALQETTSSPLTVIPIVNGLNAFYQSPGRYSNSTYQATESNGYPADGNGPNALIYNTKTVQLLASVPVDPVGGTNQLGSGSGEYREVVRYQFAPAGVVPSPSNEFYVYVSHYKSGTGSTNLRYRQGEALIIRTNEALTLTADARVLYVGDFNITTSGEASYQIILAVAAPGGAVQGQGLDPFNPGGSSNINWGTATSDTNLLAMETESATDLRYRDDLQLMTTNVYFGAPGGLQYVPGTFHAFGNNGSTPYFGTVNSASNTALSQTLAAGSPISAAQLYLDLTSASDHLPVVADYTIPLPIPSLEVVRMDGSNLVLRASNLVSNSVVTVLSSPDPGLPWIDWSVAAASAVNADPLILTVTNAVDPTADQQFFVLREEGF